VAIARNLDRQLAEAAFERLLALSYSAINSVPMRFFIVAQSGIHLMIEFKLFQHTIRKQLKIADEPVYQCQHPPSKLGLFHGQLDDRPDSQCFSFINEGVEKAI